MRELIEIIDGDLQGERHWIDGFGSHCQISYGSWTYTFVLTPRGLSQVDKVGRQP